MAFTRGIWKRVVAGSLFAALTLAVSSPPPTGALPPPLGRSSHGAAGTARNGFGGEIAPSAAGNSWPGTGANRNGGPFAFVGAQYGSLWRIPATTNNSRGVGYCVMEDVTGEGAVTLRPDPSAWDPAESARAAALMATFGGDQVVPYGIDHAGRLNLVTGEWENPLLFGSGEYTRRRQVAVNFGVRMFLEDVSPQGIAGGRKLARDTSVVNGRGGEFSALRNGYRVAQYMANVADRQSAVGGVTLKMVWGTPSGTQPTTPGTYPLEVHVTDSAGKRVGLVPVLQLSDVGIGDNRSSGAVALVDNGGDAPADIARWNAATSSGWPVWGMNLDLDTDSRFSVGSNARAADVADGNGVARFNVEITASEWELSFHVQAPTDNVDLYAGSGLQGQVTWSGRPQSASVHEQFRAPDRFVAVSKTSSNPAVSVTGTTFGLFDGSGDEVGRAAVGADGEASFDGFSPATFEPPYVLRELSAAPGLDRIAGDIALPTLAQLSTNSRQPTIIEVLNTASIARFRLHKLLDDADVQGGRDMSGFSFEVIQLATGLSLGKFTTGPDGLSEWVSAVFGKYKIIEVGRPGWAEALIDPGPITFQFTPSTGDAQIIYTNLIPDITMSTSATDRADGDKFVVLGAEAEPARPSEVVDAVTYCGLMPGTEYSLNGTIQVIADDDDDSPVPSGVVGTTTFVPTASCGEVEVLFEVPPDSALLGHAGVVFEQLTLAATGAIIAEHTDPLDVAQTLFFPSITTDIHRENTAPVELSHTFAPHQGTSGDQFVDKVDYSGLAPGASYRAEMALYKRGRDGTCAATDISTSQLFTATEPVGSVSLDGVTPPGAGTYVAFERIYSEDGMLVAIHEDCDDQLQTIWIVGMDTAVAQQSVVGSGTMTDSITVSGLADGLPDGVTATIEGALHRHEAADRSKWICGVGTRVAEFAITVDSDGEYRSPGERHELGWYSYNNKFVIEFPDGTSWESPAFGCNVETESFEALAPLVPPTTSIPTSTAPTSTIPPVSAPPSDSTPPAPSPSVAPPSATPDLPNAGSGDSARAQLIAILLVLSGGALFLATPALPLPDRRRYSRQLRDLCQRIQLRHR